MSPIALQVKHERLLGFLLWPLGLIVLPSSSADDKEKEVGSRVGDLTL